LYVKAHVTKLVLLIGNYLSDVFEFLKYINTLVGIQVDIGLGVRVPQSKLSLLRHEKPTQLARHMMDILFTREELSTSSVTGRPSNKKMGQPVKPALDPARVNALLCKLNQLCHLYVEPIDFVRVYRCSPGNWL
jgi:hypothetical protein